METSLVVALPPLHQQLIEQYDVSLTWWGHDTTNHLGGVTLATCLLLA